MRLHWSSSSLQRANINKREKSRLMYVTSLSTWTNFHFSPTSPQAVISPYLSRQSSLLLTSLITSRYYLKACNDWLGRQSKNARSFVAPQLSVHNGANHPYMLWLIWKGHSSPMAAGVEEQRWSPEEAVHMPLCLDLPTGTNITSGERKWHETSKLTYWWNYRQYRS